MLVTSPTSDDIHIRVLDTGKKNDCLAEMSVRLVKTEDARAQFYELVCPSLTHFFFYLFYFFPEYALKPLSKLDRAVTVVCGVITLNDILCKTCHYSWQW